jgi:uncharacterized membrane protein YhaH (DUF805 family)
MEPQAIIDTFRRIVTQHYFDFEGRTRRQEFWYYVIAFVVIDIAFAVVQAVLNTHALTSLLALALLLPNLGIAVRRLHDINRTGWWVLIGAIPGTVMVVLTVISFMLAGAAAGFLLLLPILSLCGLAALAAAALLIYWYAQPGTVGPNQYGPEPSAGVTAS